MAACGAGSDGGDEGVVEPSGYYDVRTPAGFPTEMAEYRTAFDASALPTAMAEGRVGPTSVFDSKFLGTPYMPKGFDYPKDPSGRPLSFIAQINFADVPAIPDYPDSGILQFYISNDDAFSEHVWGLQFSTQKPYNAQVQFDLQQSQDYFRVVWHEDVVSEEIELEHNVPGAQGYLPIDDEAKLSFTKGTSHPTPDDYRFARVFGANGYDFFERFGANANDVFDRYYSHVGIESIAWIGGYASFTQTDPREAEPDSDWLLLLEIQSSMRDDQPSVLWGDAGTGAFFIRPEDLRKRDFSSVLYNWDNY
jgi:uncharacterized protein YwqG